MRKIISLLVVLAMLMSMVPAVFATETNEYQEVTILEAAKLAQLNDGNKYLVRGTVTEVTNATNGNMYIKDAEGNTLYIYGAYDVDGSNRYDAMNTKPQVGDEVLLLGALTTYNGTAQMKNACVQELIVTNGEDVDLTLGNNVLDAGHDWTPELTAGQFVATQTGTLYITFRAFYSYGDPTFNEWLLTDIDWVQLKVNGEFARGREMTLEVAEGDVVTISLESMDGDPYHAWVYLSFDGFYEEPMGTEMNPVVIKPSDCPVDTITIPAGESVCYHLDYEDRGDDFSSDHILYVYGENAYITYYGYDNVNGGWTDIRIDAVGGVVTYAVDMYDIKIGNAGSEDAVFLVDCEVPLGRSKNPQAIENGEYTVEHDADSYGYYFEGYAPASGTLTVSAELSADYKWSLEVRNECDPNTYSDNITVYLGTLGDGSTTATIDVTEGDYIKATLRVMDADYNYCDAAVTVTFEYSTGTEEPPVEPPVDPPVEGGDELTLGYNSVEVGAEGKTYTWTAEEDGLFVLSMSSLNWTYTINGVTRSSADEEPVFMTVLAVKAGDVVTLTVATADGATEEVSFKATTAAGTAEDPVSLEMIWNDSQTAASLNADLPAGEYVYSLPIFGAGSLELTINGVKTEFNADPMGWDPATVVINNETGANAVYSIKVAPPAGTMYNPDPLQMGYNEAEMIFADYQMMRCFAFTAEEDTLLSLSMMGDNWYFWGMMQDANGMTTSWIDGHDAMTEPMVTMQVIKVAAGETFVLILGTIDGSDTVAFNAMVNAGTEADPVSLEMIWNASQTAASLNVDLPAGEYVYSLPIFGAGSLELTINGVKTEYNADPMGWDPATVVINNETGANAVYSIKVAPPAGTMYNPDPLEMGYNEAEMIFADYQMMRCFAFTAEEDTLLALTMMGDNWYFWGMMQDANGMTTAWIDGHDAMTEPMVTMQVIKVAAGETFVLILGTVDGSETVAFNAMTYAGTEEDPIMMEFIWNDEWTAAAVYADLPAGEYVYGARINGMALTVNGVETEYVPGMGRYPCLFTINNAEAGVVLLEASLPVGSMDNPEVVEDGEYTVEIEPESYTEYWYSYTAPADGKLTITVTSTTGYVFAVNNVTAGIYGDYQWSDEEPINPMTIDVKAGDVVMVMVGAYDPEVGMGAGATITVNLQFTPKPDVVLGDVNGDGAVDTTDAKLIMQYDLGLIDETGLELAAADVNGDGLVDTTDAKLVMQFDLGLITEFTKP